MCVKYSLEVAMKTLLHPMLLLLLIAASPAVAQTSAPGSHNGAAHAIYQRYQDLKWEKLLPKLGAGSAEITILHVSRIRGDTAHDPESKELSCAKTLAHSQRNAHRYLRYLHHAARWWTER